MDRGRFKIGLLRVAMAAAIVCGLGLQASHAAANKENVADSSSSAQKTPTATQQVPPSGVSEHNASETSVPIASGGGSGDRWTIAGVVAAIIAAFIYAYQAYVMRQTLVTLNRAFVFIKQFVAIPAVHVDNVNDILFWRVGAIYENSGSAPTRDMRNYVNWTYFRDGVPDNFDFPDLSPSGVASTAKLLAGPKQTITAQMHDIPVHLIAAAKAGEGVVLIWGWVEYRDVLGGRALHRTEYCSYVVADGDPRAPNCQFSFPVYERHNNADKDCEHKPGVRAHVRAQAVPVPRTQ
ncbi:hypothetical protein PQQ65_27930 [Paraburkholderia strydomiana]|uniref:hypothetical protein n=1 Tax=Paraburkholderia strydomiana TaxID=1245417 RepID=UPI0038BC6F2E